MYNKDTKYKDEHIFEYPAEPDTHTHTSSYIIHKLLRNLLHINTYTRHLHSIRDPICSKDRTLYTNAHIREDEARAR